MFLCLTNHQPKPQSQPQPQQNDFNDPVKIILRSLSPLAKIEEYPTPSNNLMSPANNDPNQHSNKSKNNRPKLLPEDPKDNAPLYINIEPGDVVSMVPTRFGGTELVYLAPVVSAELPEGVGNGGKMVQKNQISIFVKEPPSLIAKHLGIVAKGA